MGRVWRWWRRCLGTRSDRKMTPQITINPSCRWGWTCGYLFHTSAGCPAWLPPHTLITSPPATERGPADTAFLSYPFHLTTFIPNEKPSGFRYRHFSGAWHCSVCCTPNLVYPAPWFPCPGYHNQLSTNNAAIGNLYYWVNQQQLSVALIF